jgi:hypothetical protein
MSSAPTLSVRCPACQALLSVDAATGNVLSHGAAAAGPKADMDVALKALKEGKGRREDLFRRSLSDERNKGDALRKKFEDAVRKAKENPDAPPPPREVDL